MFIWANKAGHPLGVTTAYVPVDGKIWMTATRERVRIKAIARDGRSSIVITSKGTPMGGGKTVTYKGHTVIHDDEETKKKKAPQPPPNTDCQRAEKPFITAGALSKATSVDTTMPRPLTG